MGRLVDDHVVREARLDLAALHRQIAKEDGAVLWRVKGVELREGTRNEEELVATKGPAEPATERGLECGKRASGEGVDILCAKALREEIGVRSVLEPVGYSQCDGRREPAC